MKIELLISTMNKSNINNLNLDFSNLDYSTDCLVVNQCGRNETSKKGRLKLINSDTIGLSKSRNIAINNASKDICVICDDDVNYIKGFEEIIINSFKENEEIDILTFQIKTPEGELFKSYNSKEFKHNTKSILKVSSIEVAFRLKSIKDNNIKFDEDFGLGSQYISGEENIFLLDCLKGGLKAKYIPKPIAIHPNESSGQKLDSLAIYSKGALFFRLFGIKSVILNFIFIIKKANLIKISKLQSILNIYKGTLEYIKNSWVKNKQSNL